MKNLLDKLLFLGAVLCLALVLSGFTKEGFECEIKNYPNITQTLSKSYIKVTQKLLKSYSKCVQRLVNACPIVIHYRSKR